MQRICSRALALLICAVMFAGLIGARSLSPPATRDLLIGTSAISLPAGTQRAGIRHRHPGRASARRPSCQSHRRITAR